MKLYSLLILAKNTKKSKKNFDAPKKSEIVVFPKNYINGMLALTVSVGFLFIDLPSKQTAPVRWLATSGFTAYTDNTLYFHYGCCMF